MRTNSKPILTFMLQKLALVFCFAYIVSPATKATAQSNDGGVIFESASDKLTGQTLQVGGTIAYDISSHQQSLPTLDPNHPSVIKQVIWLKLDDASYIIPQGFSATVSVEIRSGATEADALNATPLTLDINSNQSRQLTVTYNTAQGSQYVARKYITIEGDNYIIVKVTGINAAINNNSQSQVITQLPGSNADIRNVLTLGVDIKKTDYFILANNASPSTFTGSVGTAPVPDELNVSWGWPSTTGNNFTQLEWAWLEDEVAGNYETNTQGNITANGINQLFKDNATRLDLPTGTNYYAIPILYDGTGNLYYRIRAISLNPEGVVTYGPWATPLKFSFSGHNNDLNWQATTTYAEEGKRKTVIQYFDGSLRGRQTVTKDNTTQTVVTAETIYDKQGRARVQILPSPGIAKVIAYQQNLNLFNSQALGADPSDILDLEPSPGVQPDLKLQLLPGSAAQYYSSSNTEKNDGNNKNLPDANGYPYSKTEYTPDATGRIAVQGGVGQNFQPGSNHETKYYYGKPMQEELDGLFGTEAGKSAHYFKNMVQDANGQVSVSYVDMHGRTIATALAGRPSADVNLKLINDNNSADYPNQGVKQIVASDLLADGSNVVKGNTIESITTVMVSDPYAEYSFNYTLSPAALQKEYCSPKQMHNYDYKYDLEITLVDESNGNVIFDDKYPGLTNTSPDLQIKEEHIKLPIGSYSLRKTLTLRDDVIQAYADDYLTPAHGVCQTLETTIQDAYTTSPGHDACNEPGYIASTSFCLLLDKDAANQYQHYLTDYYNKLGITGTPTQAQTDAANDALQAAINHCKAFDPSKSSRLADIEDAMLRDMQPYSGQYASNPSATGLSSPVNGTIITYGTMFSQFNIFAGSNAKYKNPSSALTNVNQYVNKDGSIDNSITPGQLSSMLPNAFAAAFKPSWEKSLLPYHPEYYKLQYAKQNLQSAYDWADAGLFAQTNTFAGAVANGFVNTSITLVDPLFSVSGTSTLKGNMDGYINSSWENSNGLSIWQLAYVTTLCTNVPTAAGRQSCFETAPKHPESSNAVWSDLTLPANADKADAVWQKFKQFYQSARDQIINQLINAAPGSQSSYNSDLIAQGYLLHFPASNSQALQQTGGSTNSPQAGGNQWYNPSTTNPVNQTAVDNSQSQHSANVVNGYTQIWRNELLQNSDIANTLTQEEQNIFLNLVIGTAGSTPAQGTGFKGICQRAINSAHPFGASSAPLPGGGYETFEQAFITALDTYNSLSATSHHLQLGINCNPYVITSPSPYDNSLEMVQQVTAVVDDCICSQYQKILIEAEAAGVNITNFTSLNNYLDGKYGDKITEPLFNALQKCSALPQVLVSGGSDCTTSGDGGGSVYNFTHSTNNGVGGAGGYGNEAGRVSTPCVYKGMYTLLTPQPLPAYLVCGFTGSKCVTCNAINQLSAQFTSKFAKPENTTSTTLPLTPAGSTELSDNEIKYNVAYANYLNFKTGQELQWGDYLAKFSAVNCTITSCAGSSVESDIFIEGNGSDQPGNGYIASRSITVLTGFDFTVNNDSLTLTIDSTGSPCTTTNPDVIVFCPVKKPLFDGSDVIKDPKPCQRTFDIVAAETKHIYENQVEQLREAFIKEFLSGALSGNRESFTMNYEASEYHYTLYYYDMAGSLVKTVPPKGVHPQYSNTFLASVKSVRVSGDYSNPVVPPHVLFTEYRYNSLGQVVLQQTPDAGIAQFWYDALGRLAVSQNAKQAVADGTGHKRYSYTLYDPLGRIAEVGEKPQTRAITQEITQYEVADDDGSITGKQGLANWLATDGTNTNVHNRQQITRTVYDVAYQPLAQDNDATTAMPGYINQQNLRNRVSYSELFDTDPEGAGATAIYHASATYYTYDIHGNVNRLLQDFGSVNAGANALNQTGNRFKVMDYEYDLISGKVNKVAYQPGSADAFYHLYLYDAENRIVSVKTSRDDVYYDRDAGYSYYKHGPLSQTELGELTVQQLNYAYTLQGWLKSVNTGWDGTTMPATGTTHKPAAVMGFSLHYYSNDYKAIGNTLAPDVIYNSLGANAGNLYNGNISAMAVNIPALNNTTATGKPMVYNYQYDQLNRLVNMDAFNSADNTFASLTKLSEYHEAVTYDPNGNIITYKRNGNTAALMDDLAYTYVTGTNKLGHIADAAGAHSGMGDIDDQAAGNYAYDPIGNLTGNVKEHIGSKNGTTNASNGDGITWTVYGKIATITKKDDAGNITGTTSYKYDVAGNRISKTTAGITTWYVRDASGNVMGIYTAGDNTINGGHLTLSEMPLYGSSRVGEVKPNIDLVAYAPNTVTLPNNSIAVISSFTRGQKVYELSNHLGNVLATVSDRWLPGTDISNNGIIDGTETFTAEVVSAQDYYPFGMVQPGRSFNAGTGYRYGFNGKEDDKDIETGAQDYGMRIYDSRIAKFLSVDPLENKYPYLTPYQFAGNSPIKFIDLDGLEPVTNQADAIRNIDKFATDGRESNYLKGRVDKATFVADLKNLINDKDQLNQCNTNFCGKATPTVALAIRDNPVGVTNFIISLYLSGSATYNNGKKSVTISLSERLKNNMRLNVEEDPNLQEGNWGSKTLNSAFGLLGYALSEKYHWKGIPFVTDRKYDAGDENGHWAGATFNVEKKIVGKFFGYSFKAIGNNLIQGESRMEPFSSKIQQGMSNNKTVLSLVNSHILRNGGTTGAIGTHWIQIINIVGKDFKYWEYGNKPTVSTQNFNNSFAGALIVDPANGSGSDKQ